MKARLVLFVLLLLSAYSYAQQIPQLQANDTLPVFETTDFNSQVFVLDTTALTRPMVIIFWASWNEPSKQLVEEMKQIYPIVNPVKRAKLQQNVDVIDFCIDTKQDLHQITIKRLNLPWVTHLADYKGWESDLLNKLRIQKIPTIFIIDENRKILTIDIDIKQLRNVLTNIKLNEQLTN